MYGYSGEERRVNYIGEERRIVYLSVEQAEQIAIRSAELASEKTYDRIVLAVGKGIIGKLAWLSLGGVLGWLIKMGKIAI